LALSIEVIGLKKPITQLPITKRKKNEAMSIHWKAKNNHFRFSLSLFTFFTFSGKVEK
jgi:hypothetical protein